MSKQITRPSGLRQSLNGNFIYVNCAVTDRQTFFTLAYFAESLKNKFGGDETRMAKEFVFRLVEKYRAKGYTDEAIRKLTDENGGRLPKLTDDAAEEAEAEAAASVAVAKPVQPKVVEKPVYSWSHDPQNYFKSTTPGKLNVAEATRATCFRPDLNLDCQCDGCPYYSACTCASKYDDDARARFSKAGGNKAPTIRKLVAVDSGVAKEIETVDA